ncbi:unnamed protein product [Rotaria magnacalcarata]|uniref:DDE-1 domain-containing protein n=1 Tax=Rotaria magnacalcarata TaxID=392030 RepID=A0A816Y250_9BILA|nr:unnamed protein product [Rotaria magnacalcarata]
MVNLLQANHIICLMLPSHSTHALQPLDVVVFNSVKHDWSKLFIEKAAFSPTRIVSSFAHAGKQILIHSTWLKHIIIFLGVWPFDQNAMRHKIANNISIYPTPQSSSIHHAPTNILQPRLVCSTPSMSSNSTPISCSSISSSYSPAVFANKSINTSTNIDQLPSSSSSLLNLFDPVSNSIHTTFQSFPLDLTLNIRS